MISENIGPYKLIKCCGKGAYGEVYFARNTLNEAENALKIINSGGKIQERELRGLIKYRSCKHPNLVQIFHVDYFNDSLYYTMELANNLSGKDDEYIPDTLGNRLNNGNKLSAEEIISLKNDILAGIQFLHKNGLVHRDIKPDNILKIGSRYVLGDIGLVTDTAESSLLGTPDFMSPDLLKKARNPEPQDDYYAFSRVLYCAFTGNLPKDFPALPPALLNKNNSHVWQAILELDGCKTDKIASGKKFKKAVLYLLLLFAVILSFFAVFVMFLVKEYSTYPVANLPVKSHKKITGIASQVRKSELKQSGIKRKTVETSEIKKDLKQSPPPLPEQSRESKFEKNVKLQSALKDKKWNPAYNSDLRDLWHKIPKISLSELKILLDEPDDKLTEEIRLVAAVLVIEKRLRYNKFLYGNNDSSVDFQLLEKQNYLIERLYNKYPHWQ
ncbi:MAG: protein kinase [Lentisphaeria bacterium]|nr:protein kinase [Lentisphaeria bacterium]